MADDPVPGPLPAPKAGLLPILDFNHLDRRTMGDAALQVEVLALFSAEAERLLRQVVGAASEEVRRDRLLAMEALARSIGARRLSAAAAEASRSFGGDFEAVQRALDEVMGHIGSLPG